jgi:hypothetical protein
MELLRKVPALCNALARADLPPPLSEMEKHNPAVRTVKLCARDLANFGAALGLRGNDLAPLWRALAHQCGEGAAPYDAELPLEEAVARARTAAAAQDWRDTDPVPEAQARATFCLTAEDLAALPRPKRSHVQLGAAIAAAHRRYGDAAALARVREAHLRAALAAAAAAAAAKGLARRAAKFLALLPPEEPTDGVPTDYLTEHYIGQWVKHEDFRGFPAEERSMEALVVRAARWAELRLVMRRMHYEYCPGCNYSWCFDFLSGRGPGAEAVVCRLWRRAWLMGALGVRHGAFLEPKETPWAVAGFTFDGEGSPAAAAARELRDRALRARLASAGVSPHAAQHAAQHAPAACAYVVDGGDLEAAVAGAVAAASAQGPAGRAGRRGGR